MYQGKLGTIMGDLRSELEQITARFVSTVLAAARAVPLDELRRKQRAV